MLQTITIQVIIFLTVFLLFFPLLNRTIKLAFAAYDNREYISREDFRKTVIITPVAIVTAFVVMYYFVLFLYKIFET